jgi:sulfur-oxidizing protein SoxZ
MSEPKPRIRVPATAKVGDVIEIKTLVQHVMETGNRKTADGKVVPRNIINSFTASFDGKEFFKADIQPGISANPYLAFFMKVTGPGELEFTWIDDAGVKVSQKSPLAVG